MKIENRTTTKTFLDIFLDLMVQNTPHLNDKEQIISTLVTLIQQICGQQQQQQQHQSTNHNIQEICEQLKDNNNNNSLQFPILLKTFCELSSMFTNTKSMSFLDIETLKVNNNNNNNNEQQQTSTQQQLQTPEMVDGVLITLTSFDMVISLMSGLQQVISYIFESTSQFLPEVITPFWFTLSFILKSNIATTDIKLLNDFQCPLRLCDEFLDSLLKLAQSTITITNTAKDQSLLANNLSRAIKLASSILSDNQFFLFGDRIVHLTPIILSNSNSISIKKTILELYYRILLLSQPSHQSIVNLIPFLSDQSIQSVLIDCFRKVLDHFASSENNINNNNSNNQFNGFIINKLIQTVQHFNPQEQQQQQINQLNRFIFTFSTVVRICNGYNEYQKELLELFIHHIGELYKFVIAHKEKEKEIDVSMLPVINEALSLCLTVVTSVVHPNIHMASSIGSQYKFTLDSGNLHCIKSNHLKNSNSNSINNSNNNNNNNSNINNNSNNNSKEIVINNSMIIELKQFKIDSLISISQIFTTNYWLPKCKCQDLETSSVKTQNMSDFTFKQLFTTDNQIPSIIKYLYLSITFKTQLGHLHYNEENIKYFFEHYFKNLITDTNEIIRNSLIDIIVSMIKLCPSISSKDFILSQLFTNLKPIWNMENEDVLLSIIRLFGKISKLIQIDTVYFLLIVCSLIDCFGRSSHLCILSNEMLDQIARLKNTNPRAMINTLAPTLYPIVIEHIKENVAILNELSSRVLKTDLTTFINNALPHILPTIFAKQNQPVLNELKSRCKLKDAAYDQLSFVLEHIFMSSPGNDQLVETLVFLANFLEWQVKDIITFAPRLFYYRLILNLGDASKAEQAKVALKWAFSLQEVSAPSAAAFELFLMKDFLGTMNHFNSIMTNKQKPLAEKENMMGAVRSLLELLGGAVNRFRPKIMAFLKLAVNTPLEAMSIDIWLTFVKLLDINSVGPILNQLVVSVLHLVNSYPDRAILILDYLIVEKQAQLHTYFHTIPLLPDYPVLQRIIGVLAKYSGKTDLKTQITQLIQLFGNESSDVKNITLDRLQKLLREHRLEINKFICDDVPIISDLTKALLIGCRDPFDKVQVAFIECLGELGAIDPERFNFKLRNEVHDEKNRGMIAYDLIVEYLAKFVCSPSNPTPQDRAGYAIQEILKICGCTEANQTIEGKDLWDHFTPEVKEILYPFLTSEYLLPPSRQIPPRDTAFFTPKTLYKKWLISWVSDLLNRTGGPNEPIFKSCRGIIKDDLKICHYLLPLLIINIFEFGKPEDIKLIQIEILEVLKKDTDLSSENGQMCTQRIFEIINSLNKWIDTRKKKNESAKMKSMFNVIDGFLNSIPETLLSTASQRCGALSISLMQIESHIRKEINEQPKDIVLNNNLPFLLKIYHDLNDIDGLAGLAALRTKSTVDEKIMEFESNGSWNDAFVYYTNAANNDPGNYIFKLGKLKSMFHLGHYDTVLTLAEGLKKEAGNYNNNNNLDGINSSIITGDDNPISKYNSFAVQAAWRLSKWDMVESILQQPYDSNFEVSIGQILMALYHRNEHDFNMHLYQARLDLTQYISAASLDSLDRCYPYLTQLHILRDIETSWKLHDKNEESNIINELNDRFKLVQPLTKIREPILTVQRVIYEIFDQRHETSKNWLQIAKYSRHERKFENALNALLAPKIIEDKPYIIEKAKLCFAKGQTNEAINILAQEVGSAASTQQHSSSKDQQQQQKNSSDSHSVKMHLLLAKWKQQCGSSHSELLIHFKQASLYKWEKGLFYLGKFYDSVLSSMKKNGTNFYQFNSKSMIEPYTLTKYVKKILSSYGQSLVYGHNYVYHSLTRFLTVWTDFGTTLLDNSDLMKDFKAKYLKSKQSPMKSIDMKIKQMKKIISEIEGKIPPYLWLTFFPQLISRINHKNPDTWDILESIIVKVLVAYPLQANWIIVSLLKSKDASRVERAKKCFEKACKDSASIRRHDEISRLSECLIALGESEATGKKDVLRMSVQFKELASMKNLNVMVPIQSNFNPTLPPSGVPEENFMIFDPHIPTIQSFEDQIVVMPSMQKPKKITIVGSTGQHHLFLVKPKDDLRKDSRIMEFSTMVNKLLRKDPDCRRRRLLIRTYSVVPLNEECGLIEWVPNVVGLRNIIMDLYKPYSNFPNSNRIRELYGPNNKSMPRLDILSKHILPYAPPVFYKWFLNNFPEPSMWLEARTNYIRTTAVYSMVGAVIGLGDRHGENILYDSTNGECLHVDINCVFWKGKTFQVPERVPFRLTVNMIDAFGVSGVEGAFRIACEHTLRLLRTNREALLSLLETFIYDPLLEWRTKSSNENDKAVEIINNINRELQGLPSDIGLPLSIEGQVTSLIQEASDIKNLAEIVERNIESDFCIFSKSLNTEIDFNLKLFQLSIKSLDISQLIELFFISMICMVEKSKD
ncbi:protein kinase [Heterostelium album PN500]|uniref:non-specific serine/threonine protein kinase n=1 Tax=Heterostelium pallidum (strain ATCC 26659 / Pp 5 / PN500) TaxID=670386 RepID=D3BTW9_HETP5|nr:protein kinase [Heterostelium album PN500]EFA75155.1 protein kinase [Heterostelium album PN500]|eukprot:XP_020427289.1 protein kinase [Heterostelium album PN500]